MKTLRVIACGLLVLCGGLVFAACKDKKQDKTFDIEDITIGNVCEVVYDGQAHIVEVGYDEELDVDVTYALSTDKNNFKTKEELNIVNVGDYKLYYKLSAKGYKDYVSAGTLNLSITPRTLKVKMNDITVMKSDLNKNVIYGYAVEGAVQGDNTGLKMGFGNNFNAETANYGDVYDVVWTITNPNYKLQATKAKAYISDYVQINKADGTVKSYYSKLQDAIDNVEAGEVVVLNNNISTKESIIVNRSVVIDGLNQFSIQAEKSFKSSEYAEKTLNSLITVKDPNVELTLKNVVINGNKVARGVSAFHGKVTIDGATIRNGKKTDKWRSGGVFITNDASFSMTSGSIVNNNANDTEYTKYCADLWIGANVQGSLVSITGGQVGNVFVNSNRYSAVGAGMFLLDGGKITNIFVEYDSGYGAQFNYVKGDVKNLYVAVKNDNGNYYGECCTLTPVEGTMYVGGRIVYANTQTEFYDQTFDESNMPNFVDGWDYVFDHCTFEVGLNITSHSSLVFNDCTFTSNQTTGLYVTSATDLLVSNCTFNGTTTNGYAIDVNLYSTVCKDVVIINNIFNTTSDDNNGAIAIKTRLGATDYPSESWANNEVEGKIENGVVVLNNKFNEDNYVIQVGTLYQSNNTSANTSTGAFNLLVENNYYAKEQSKFGVEILNMFKIKKGMLEENYEDLGVVIKLLANGVYDSTK